MRTASILLVVGVFLSIAAPLAAAEAPADTSDVTKLLPVGLLPKLGDQTPSPNVPKETDLIKDVEEPGILGAIFQAIVDASAEAVTGFLGLGLMIADGAFSGMDEGGEVVVAAAQSVAAKPVSSAVAASVTLAVAGAASGLAYLLQRYGSLGSIALPLYSRIARSHLLENPVRSQIFQLIQENPGINVSEISRRLDVAWGTVTHHLQKLRAERLVSVRIASNQKCYFQNGGSYTPREMDVLSATKSDTAKRIAEYLVQNGPRSHREVAEALDLAPALLSFHASRLAERGILSRTRDGRRTILAALETNLNPAPRPAAAH